MKDEDQDQDQRTKEKVIHLDETTAAMLQAIADLPDDPPAEGIGQLFQKFGIDLDLDAVTAFLKATGQQDRPEAKAIIEQITKQKNNGPTP